MGHPSEHDSPEPLEPQITELAGAFANALLAGDEPAAELVVRDAMDAGLSSADIDEKLIAPALWLVGELWERAELSVEEEHRATGITLRVLALQREAVRVSRSRPKHRVLLATPSGESHVVALRMVANLLQDAGYDVLMLGGDVPASAIRDTAAVHQIEVVCLSMTMPGHRDETLRVIDEIRQKRPDARFVIGGRGISVEGQLRHDVQVCDRVSDAVEAVDAAVQHAAMN